MWTQSLTKRFNSRLREEATRSGCAKCSTARSFNSRLREEATNILHHLLSLEIVSTHASVRRRHPDDADINKAVLVSTHASVRRRRFQCEVQIYS